MDVVSFIAVVVLYIWVVLPFTNGDPFWNGVFIVAAVAVAVVSFWKRRVSLARLGLRVDNLLPASLAYLLASVSYAGLVLLWHREILGTKAWQWPEPDRLFWFLIWAFLQQMCLLAFLLNRLQEIFGGRRVAVLAAVGVFACFHLPNPFLTLYTLGGGLIVAVLFLRLPNLLAAALAHATASALVSGLLPGVVTGRMKVGPLYWWATQI